MNLHYGQDPGVKFYTHLSDQFGPFHTRVIAATANEAPHVLDGLLYHQSSLVIKGVVLQSDPLGGIVAKEVGIADVSAKG